MTSLSSIMFSVLAFLSISLPALAQIEGPMTAVQLQGLCNSRYDVDAGMCAGYVMAIAERLQQDSDPLHHVCLSPAIGAQTLVENLQRAWAVQPPQPQDLATTTVAGALRDRFRCL